MIALIIVVAALLVSIAVPAFTTVAVKTLETRSMNHAKQIGFACREYATDHAGNYPPSLNALVPEYLPDRDILRSPLNPSDPVGYVYTPGLRDDSPGDAVLLVDKFAPDLKHERIVIHADDSAAVQNLPRNHWW
jgi:hypothetical protein